MTIVESTNSDGFTSLICDNIKSNLIFNDLVDQLFDVEDANNLPNIFCNIQNDSAVQDTSLISNESENAQYDEAGQQLSNKAIYMFDMDVGSSLIVQAHAYSVINGQKHPTQTNKPNLAEQFTSKLSSFKRLILKNQTLRVPVPTYFITIDTQDASHVKGSLLNKCFEIQERCLIILTIKGSVTVKSDCVVSAPYVYLTEVNVQYIMNANTDTQAELKPDEMNLYDKTILKSIAFVKKSKKDQMFCIWKKFAKMCK
jgi:hypothetical protein